MRGSLEDLDWILYNDRSLVEAWGPTGKTPIMISIEHEKHELAQWFVESGVKLNSKESITGNTALHIAALKGDPVTCKLIFTAYP